MDGAAIVLNSRQRDVLRNHLTKKDWCVLVAMVYICSSGKSMIGRQVKLEFVYLAFV